MGTEITSLQGPCNKSRWKHKTLPIGNNNSNLGGSCYGQALVSGLWVLVHFILAANLGGIFAVLQRRYET